MPIEECLYLSAVLIIQDMGLLILVRKDSLVLTIGISRGHTLILYPLTGVS